MEKKSFYEIVHWVFKNSEKRPAEDRWEIRHIKSYGPGHGFDDFNQFVWFTPEHSAESVCGVCIEDTMELEEAFKEGKRQILEYKASIDQPLYITSLKRNGDFTTKECKQNFLFPVKTDTPLSGFTTTEIFIYHYAKDEIEAEQKALLTIFHELRDIITWKQNNS